MADKKRMDKDTKKAVNDAIKDAEDKAQNPISDEQIFKELDEINEKEYLAKIKKKNKKYLIELDYLEKERIAQHISDLYITSKVKHKNIEDKIDNYDDIYRMKPIVVSEGTEDSTTYRTPLSTVTLEVVHANIMNVFFTPADVMRVLPTEKNDISKVNKLETFGNWSMRNEMRLFEKIDRLFHSSAKNGECPYIVYWTKEYGTEIKIEKIPNPLNPSEPLFDIDTKEPIVQESEVTKLLYSGPTLEVFSRKDYILPENTTTNFIPSWEMRRVRISADKVRRSELEGKYYEGTAKDIGWGSSFDSALTDTEDNVVPMGKDETEFIEFYGKLRIKTIKEGKNEEEDDFEELEDEFIAVVEPLSQTLCSLRKNKFPLKMRPIGLDVFMPDDEGRAEGIGIMEFMESIQQSHDLLHNQYLTGSIQANEPVIFFTPLGNTKREPIKIKHGYMYPTSDPNSIKFERFPSPDQSLWNMMEKVENQAQALFGISDYAQGMESSIDPSAPARKAELVVAQGNVRLNLIIRRKNNTLKDIFKRWFLLYQANMPPNKFMRIAGESKENPWKFEAINMSDFSLNAIPDFELTGNVLNANKSLEIQKVMGIYNLLIVNPFFSPKTSQGIAALHALTKWTMDKLDETGISNFLPTVKTEIFTPEEENARFLQGDEIKPMMEDDHVYHMKTHDQSIFDTSIPAEIRDKIFEHNKIHAKMISELITKQRVMSMQENNPQNMGMTGGMNGPEGMPQPAQGPVPEPGMEGMGAGAPESIQ